MSGTQPSLAGLMPARPTDRLFFAVFPDAECSTRIERLAQHLRDELGLRGRVIASGRLHVTLHHLGDHAGLDGRLVEAACAAGTALESEAFDVVFDRVASFRGRPRNRPFVLRGAPPDLADLIVLQRRLADCMRRVGLAHHVEPRYTPHVTLLYDDVVVSERLVSPVSWCVDEVCLVHSLLGRTEHRVLGRWSLRPTGQEVEPRGASTPTR